MFDWLTEHGCDTEHDREWLEDFKGSLAYRNLAMMEEERQEYDREQERIRVKQPVAADTRSTGCNP
jgi:hypothetical protein